MTVFQFGVTVTVPGQIEDPASRLAHARSLRLTMEGAIEDALAERRDVPEGFEIEVEELG